MEQENEPLLIVKPKFNLIQYITSKYLLTIVAIIFLMIFTLQVYTGDIAHPEMYFIIAIVAYLVYAIIRTIIQKSKYKKVQYWFYDDSVLIINRNKKANDTAIGYRELVDILMVQTFIQKYFNQGDLILKLSEGKVFAKHVTLMSIPDYEKTTQKISEIVYGS